MKRYFTTPLYYVNATPHLGHAYTTVLVDVLKRYYRQRLDEVVFLTGTDEHGEKIAKMATQQGKTPQQLADEVSTAFKNTWQTLGLDFDIFYRTTDPAHRQKVQTALTRLKEGGEIVFREYEGHYCVGCERFLTETELTPQGLCPDHQTAPESRKEGNYFFLMSRYQQKLIEHYEKNPKAIRPEHFRSEVLSFLREPLNDLCISRPKERLTWGIELPFDSRFVTYVWVDALLNYLAATGWPDPAQYDPELWKNSTHFIAKDILKTHAVYWPSLLMALGVEPFKELQVSGYWLTDGTKMSKSLGNVIRPLEVEAQYGQETLRFYLLREMSYGLDATFSFESYTACINAYLANGFGNLASRVLTLCQKNFGQDIEDCGKSVIQADQDVLNRRMPALNAWDEAFQQLKYQNALKAWSDLVTATDLYINEQKPWALAKNPEQRQRLQTVLWTCLQVLNTLSILIEPVLPLAAKKLQNALGFSNEPVQEFRLFDLARATRNTSSFRLSTEVPKLFMRVSLPPSES